jgi:hypothetical protein
MPVTDGTLDQRLAKVERDLAATRGKLCEVEDWADGIVTALLPLLWRLLPDQPSLAASVMEEWESLERDYEQALRGDPAEWPLQHSEAAAICARVCRHAEVPSPSGRAAPANPPRLRRAGARNTRLP